MKTKTINAQGEAVTYDYGDRYADPNRGPDRRKNGDKKGGHQIAEMWDRHHEIARLLVLGMSNVDVAKEVGCSAQLVSSVRNSPIVKDKMAVMRAVRDADTADLGREIQMLAPVAIQRVKEALESGTVLGKEVSASGILKEANTLIDREIGKPTQRIDTRNAHVHFTREDIEAIKERAKALAMTTDQAVNG